MVKVLIASGDQKGAFNLVARLNETGLDIVSSGLKIRHLDVQSGFVGSGKAALSHLEHDKPDMVVLFDGLEDMSAVDVMKVLRVRKDPVLAMGIFDREDVRARVDFLNAGGDATENTPFDIQVLKGRMGALLKRNQSKQDHIVMGSVMIDRNQQICLVHGQVVNLSPSQFRVLSYLASHEGEEVSKNMIMNHLYGNSDHPSDRIISVFVTTLKNKLRAAGVNDIEVTGRKKKGYTLTLS